MPVNKNALSRYKIIDRSLRNRYRRWTMEDLVDEVSDALYDMEGTRKGISLRTVQNDIQIMRSDKLGYNAPIEVYDQKYYRYADPDYSITELPFNCFNCSILVISLRWFNLESRKLPQRWHLYCAAVQRLFYLLSYRCRSKQYHPFCCSIHLSSASCYIDARSQR